MNDAVALAEKVLALLDQGVFVATYKYAVLLGLLDLVLEKTSAEGRPPTTLTTRDLAENVTARYWQHCTPYPEGALVLRQNRSAPGTQAEVLSRIQQFKSHHDLPFARARLLPAYQTLVRFVEWKLIEMPLPRLQYIGNTYDPFLYDIDWDRQVRQSEVTAYQHGHASLFEGLITLKPGVAGHLTRLNALLRPLIQRQWAGEVAKINKLPEAKLEGFLFGIERTPTLAVREHLLDYQKNRCFYCGGAVLRRERLHPEVDHFIPWARYPDNGLENLVIAHQGCNHRKRDFLSASGHVERWLARFADQRLTAGVEWESHPAETRGVAAAIYTGIPEGTQLWLEKDIFEPAVPAQVRLLFSSSAQS